MHYSPLAIKRSFVLGDLYKHCESIESIPVYLNDKTGELLGHVDESLGHYADAFLFHLPEDVCKKLSASQYTFAFDYELLGKTEESGKQKRIRLNHIFLIGRKIPAKKVVVV